MGTHTKKHMARACIKRFFYVFLCAALVFGGSPFALAEEAPQSADAAGHPAAPAAANTDWTSRPDILALSLTELQYKDGGQWKDLTKNGSAYTFPAGVAVEALSELRIGFCFDIDNDAAGYMVQPGDTFTTAFPAALPLSPTVVSGECHSPTGTAIAAFLVDHAANAITFTFTQEIDGFATFGGGCTFDLELDHSALNSAGATTVDIDLLHTGTPDASVTFPARSVPSGVSKSGNYDPLTGQLTWEIVVGTDTKGVSLDGYMLRDVLPAELTLVSAGIRRDGSLAPIPDFATSGYTFAAGDKTPQSFTVVTQVSDDILAANTGAAITNEAVLSHGSDPEPSPGAWKGADTVNVPATSLGKQGTQVDANTIRWEIKLNTGKPANLLRDAVVTDQLSAGLAFVPGSVTLNNKKLSDFASEGAGASCDAANKLTITMPKTIDGPYTIRFDTQVANGSLPGVDLKVKNIAEMTWTVPFADGGNGKSVTYGTPQIETDFNTVFLNKSSPSFDHETGYITWRIDPSVRLNTYTQAEVTDAVTADQQFVPGSVVVRDGNTVLGDTAVAAIFSADASLRNLSFTFSSDPAQANYAPDLDTVVIEYKTKALPYFSENNVAHTYQNSAHLDVDATYTADGHAARTEANKMLAKAAAYTFNETENEGYMHYTIGINASKTALTDVVVTDDIGAIATTFSTFSGGAASGLPAADWSLDLKKSYLDDASAPLSSLVAGGAASYEGKLLSVSLGDTADTHTLHLFLRLANKDDYFRQNVKISAQNSASITANELPSGSAAFHAVSPVTAANTIENKLSTKKSAPCVVADSGSYIQWNVNINPNGATLKAPVVTDVLPQGLEFDSASIVLSRSTHNADGRIGAAGSPVDPSLYRASINGNELSVTLPVDNDSYTLAYRTYIVGEIMGGNAQNDIALYDGDTQLDTSAASQGVSNSAWGYLTRTTACVIQKTDADSLAADSVPDTVPGAVYGLFTTPDASGTPFKTGVTDADGRIVFRGLAFGAQYYVKELQAPTGYAPDPAVYPYQSEVPANRLADIQPLAIAEKRVSADVTIRKADAFDFGLSLPGVGFTLARTFGGTKPDGVPVQLVQGNGKYEYAGVGSAQEAAQAATGQDGRIVFASLPRDTYILTEIQPLDGYLAPDDPHFLFEVRADGSVAFDTASGISESGVIANTPENPPATPPPAVRLRQRVRTPPRPVPRLPLPRQARASIPRAGQTAPAARRAASKQAIRRPIRWCGCWSHAVQPSLRPC